ncbi:MAG TPA: acyl-CoA dehydrogenase family protein [Mycobacteriales bacterium]|nr:acyl-CoA dehydrogenase family protein [Mycobacteriales bacterium]
MQTSLSPEQQALRAAVRDFCAEHGDPAAVRAAMATDRGYDDDVWQRLTGQLGIAGLAVAEEHGGAGGDLIDLCVALSEIGRVVLPVPLLGTVWAAAAIALTGDDDALALLPGLASGELRGAVAVDGAWAGDPGTGAGALEHVLDGHVADIVVVAIDDAVLLVDTRKGAVTVNPVMTLDQTRRQAHIGVGSGGARLLASDADLVRRAQDIGRVLLAAECAGGARACLDTTVAYMNTREQFGRLIGSFQALQHRCADLAVLVEGAEATALCASWTAQSDPDELRAVGPLAKAVCAGAYRDVARAMIQLHGGVGFTWEHVAHLHLKRATTSDLVLGDATHCRGLVAEAVGI